VVHDTHRHKKISIYFKTIKSQAGRVERWPGGHKHTTALYFFLPGRVGPEVTSRVRQFVARHYTALTQDIAVRGYTALTHEPRGAGLGLIN